MTFSFEPIEVLLVEDDAGDELMTREAFAEHKISNRLHVVRDGQQALDFLFRTGPYTGAPRVDLILLDLNLPKYDGRQVLERIKSCAATSCTPTLTSPSPWTSTSSSPRSGRSTSSSCRWCACRASGCPVTARELDIRASLRKRTISGLIRQPASVRFPVASANLPNRARMFAD